MRDGRSSPIGDEGNTVLVVDGSLAPAAGPMLVALDAATGAVRWRHPWTPAGQYTGMGVGHAAVHGDLVVTLAPDGNSRWLVGLDAASGSQRWRQPVGDVFSPLFCGDLICVLDRAHQITARDPSTGVTRWVLDGAYTTVANVGGDRLSLLRLGQPAVLSVDVESGHERWHTDLAPVLGPGATTYGGWSSAEADGLTIVSIGAYAATGWKGALVAIDPSSGAVRWQRQGSELCPVDLPDNLLLVCDGSSVAGTVERLDPATGVTRWRAVVPPSNQGLGPSMGLTGAGDLLVPTIDASTVEADSSHDASALPGGSVVVDIESGRTHPAPSGEPFWMASFSTVDILLASGQEPTKYLGPFDPVPWDAALGRPSPAGASVGAIPSVVGTTANGYRIYIDALGAVHGVPIPS